VPVHCRRVRSYRRAIALDADRRGIATYLAGYADVWHVVPARAASQDFLTRLVACGDLRGSCLGTEQESLRLVRGEPGEFWAGIRRAGHGDRPVDVDLSHGMFGVAVR